MQKFIKIMVALLLVISFGLPNVAIQSFAAEQWTEYPTNTTGDVNKSWKITFSGQVDSKTVSNNNVYIENTNGTKVDVLISINDSIITVTPKVAYTVGETYTLYLLSSIQSMEEKPLTNTKFQFRVLGALEMAYSVAQEAQNTAEAIKITQPVFANPLSGTKDEITRAKRLVDDLEKAIATAREKVTAAQALITAASKAGFTAKELAEANTAVTATKKSIANAETEVKLAKQAIETASITAQLPVASVEVTSYSTLQVTLAETPTYELTKTDISKFSVNVDGEIIQVSDVVKEASYDNRYKLTIETASTKYPLFGKQGSLSVNNTQAVIKNSEYGYDFKAPTINSVEVIDSLHIKVHFSEKMSESAAVVRNYGVFKSTAPTTDLLGDSGTVGVLSADRKSVTLTLNNSNALVAANYTLKVTGTVRDVASQALKANTTEEFSATASQLVDKTRPSLTTADYDPITGILNVTFDEKVTISSISQILLGGVSLTGASTIASNEGTWHRITLTPTVKDNVDKKITNLLRLTIAAGAVKDAATSPNYNALTHLDLEVVIPPKAIEASYSEYTKRLRLTFDQSIQMGNVDKTKISVGLNGATHTLAGGKIHSTVNGTTLIIELTKDDSRAIEANAGDSVTGTVELGAGAVKNTTEYQTANAVQSNIPLTYSQDTGKPSVEEVTVQSVPNRNNDTIVVEFTEPMEESSAKNLDNYAFELGTPSKPVPLTTDNATIKLSEDLKKATITLKGIDLQTKMAFSLQVSNIIDLTGEMLDIEKRTGTVTGDLTAPILKSVSGSTSDTQDIVIVHFSEAVKKDSAEKIENYTIESPTGTSLSTNITPKLSYTETDTNNDGTVDEFKLEIKYTKSTPLEILQSGGTVKVSASAVIDLAGNEMIVGKNVEGTVSDGVPPTITSVQGKTVQSDLDEIYVEFSEDVMKTTAENPVNYKLEVAENNVPLSNLKVVEDIKYDANEKTVTLYLDTSSKKNGHDPDDYALKNGQSIKITVTDVKDVEGNVIVAPDNWKEGSVSGETEPATIVPTSVKVTGANTVQMTWNEELDATTLQVTDFELKGSANENYQITAAKIDETKKIVILTTKKAIAFDEAGLLLSSVNGIQLKDLAGNLVSTFNESVTALGTAASYSLKGASVTAEHAKYISVGKHKQISDLFKLTAGTTANDEGFTVDTISFNVTTTARVLDKVQLMWSTDAKVGNNDDVVVSTAQTNLGNKTLTFEGINKTIPSAGDGYFYILADVSYSGTVTVKLLAGATATSTQTKFKVESKESVKGKEIIIDTTAPILKFKNSTSTSIIVKIVDESPLADALSKLELNPETKYASLFEIVGKAAGTSILSATYNEDKTFTITTSAGLPTDGFIRLKEGELIDMAGNPLAATFIAQGNGTDKLFVNPYLLNDVDSYEGNIIQNKLEQGDVTYGPNTSDTKKITGDVKIIGPTGGTITLQNLEITGDLTIITPNTSIVIGENVAVGQTLKIQDVSSVGVINNGVLKEVEITDGQSTSLVNNGQITNVSINVPTNNVVVKLGGTFPTVNVLKSAKLQIESGATISILNVAESVIADITNNGVIQTLAGNGTAIERGTKAKSYDGIIGANTAVAAIKATTNANDIGTTLNAYHSVLGIVLTDYNSLPASYKNTVNTALYNGKNSYADVTAIKTAFDQAVATQKAFAAIKNVTNATALENIFMNNVTALGIDLSEYNQLINKSAVNQTIFNGRTGYATVEAFRTAFNTAVATATANQQKDGALASKSITQLTVVDKEGVNNNGKVTATWTPFTQSDISETGTTGYEIYYAPGTTVSKEISGAQSVKVSGTSTNSVDIGGLGDQIEYAFVIYAVNANGAYSNTSTIKTATAVNHVAATAGKSVGSIVLADDTAVDTLVADRNISFTVTFDNTVEIPITISSATATKLALLYSINTAISGKGIASYNANNNIVITSVTKGITSIVSIGGADKEIFFGTPTETSGMAASY